MAKQTRRRCDVAIRLFQGFLPFFVDSDDGWVHGMCLVEFGVMRWPLGDV
jgi:hypothetical protein